jgi:P-aminobenzoate N-oxygenase AurF
MESENFEAVVERMIRISKDKPLLPETFIPWADEPGPDTPFIPDKMVSLQGHTLWTVLTREQQIELGRLEVVQVMYSYAWSETLACYFFNRHLLTLNPDSVEYRFLIREIIEEFRHQEMFGMAIRKLDRIPIQPTRLHKFFGNVTVGWLPSSMVFMSVLSVELMADIYAKHIRQDPTVFSVMRKSSELHHIEEGRHIFYTEAWLEKFTKGAGFIKATTFSLLVMLNIYFMRTLYVQKEFFIRLGVADPEQYYRAALKNYNTKFSEFALQASIDFVQSFNGFNWISKPLWRWLLKVKV